MDASLDREKGALTIPTPSEAGPAVGVSIGLQVAVVYVPFLQRAFSTKALSGPDWLRCTALASIALWVREANKLFKRVGRALRIRLRPLESVRVSA